MREQIEKLGQVLSDGLKASAKMPLRRHRDDDYWDRLVVEAPGVCLTASMVPRYKTSDLSGDEWRVSALLVVESDGKEVVRQGFHRMSGLTSHAAHFVWQGARSVLDRKSATMLVSRKGIALVSLSFPTFGDAAMGMGWHITIANEGSREWRHLKDAEERVLCQQVGCGELPKNFYRLKKLCVNSSGDLVEPKYDFTGQFTWYCARHTTRGDCGLEDADDNMVLVDGNGVAISHAVDESPSVLGGVIDLRTPTPASAGK